ncbi:MAG: pantetheine-phosphate adenylyltransferase [Actinomycetota bacterium]
MGVAFYPGSFDPFHLGHLDIVEQAVGMFGELVIGVMHNPVKPSGMFTADERADLIRQSTTHLGKAVCVEKFSGLTVDAAASIKATFIVKSARTGADFETEQQMAHTNRAATGINTVVLFSTPEHQFISSTYIRQFAQQGGTMRSNLAPQCVLEALAKKKS